jgi:hypothetical protein
MRFKTPERRELKFTALPTSQNNRKEKTNPDYSSDRANA